MKEGGGENGSPVSQPPRNSIPSTVMCVTTFSLTPCLCENLLSSNGTHSIYRTAKKKKLCHMERSWKRENVKKVKCLKVEMKKNTPGSI